MTDTLTRARRDRHYTHSTEVGARLARATPGGSQTASKAPGRAGPRTHYPQALECGQGAWVTDVDGHVYVDWVAGLAAVGLGHAHGSVCAAVIKAIQRGHLLSLPTTAEVEASERLCAITGWAEQARWVKTGSEATAAAVRIARRATGREKVLTIRDGYHGWHDWFQAVKPQHPGVPEALELLIGGMPYGRVPNGSAKYAAVILEPTPIDRLVPKTDGHAYLTDLITWAHANGTLVIFDEVVWGFRLDVAGGTHYYGVTPDLATYGKALGNGVPVAAVVGRRDLMQHADVISGTYGGDRLGLEAALAVMDVYEQRAVVPQLWATGQALVRELGALCRQHSTPDLRWDLTGAPVHPVLRPTTTDVDDYRARQVMSLLLQELAIRGVLWHPGGVNVMFAHRPRHVDTTVNAFADALHEVTRQCASGEELPEPYGAAFTRARS